MVYSALKVNASLLIALFFFSLGSPVYAQSPELLRSGLMRSPTVEDIEPDYEAPSLSEITRGQSRVKNWDLLPRELSLSYPNQSRNIQDTIIDPKTYIIGPGDLFAVYLWGELDKSFLLRVTPEGYLVIPTAGAIMAADKTIDAVGDSIKTLISKLYNGTDSSFFLYEPRRFRLYVSGIVYIPGMHESSAVERVSDVIERAGIIIPGKESLPEEKTQETENKYGSSSSARSEQERKAAAGVATQEGPEVTVPKHPGTIGRTYATILGRTSRISAIETLEQQDLFTLGEKKGSSSRLITIHRKDEKITADLLRFIKLGDLDANPNVNSGDRIEVPPYNGDITVSGEVNDQGIYEFKAGDRVCDLVGFGGGLTSVADTSCAQLVKFEPDGRSFKEITIDLYDALYKNPDSPQYSLQESDRLYIRKKFDYKILSDVTVYGEVKYPGQYAIAKNATTLSELVRMAGGFTGDENLDEARLVRKGSFAERDMEYERIKEIEPFARTPEERDYINSYRRTFEGTINTNFVKLFRENDKNYDIVLQDGDVVYIPLKRDFVNVMGAVKEPGYVQVKEDEGLDYYIGKVGGYNWDASKRNTRIYKARASQKYKPGKKTKIEAGDTIHVPERGNFWSYFKEYSGYVTIFTTIYLIGRG